MLRISRPVLAAAFAAGLLAGCSSTKEDPTANWSPDRIYTEARDEATAGAFDKAVPLFEKLEGRAAGTPLAQQAQIEKAYAQYKAGEKEQAHATLDRFIRLHPTSPAIDYALYLKGLVNFNDNLGMFAWLSRQDLSERDPKGAREAFDSFRELTERFPESRYADDSRARMQYLVNSLASHEVHVARYYYNRGAYVAAANRAQTAVSNFPQAPATEEALFLLVKSYDAMGLAQLRDDAERVMRTNFPNSVYFSGGPQDDRPWWQLW